MDDESRLLLVNLDFFVCHVFWSGTEQHSVSHRETNVPRLPQTIVGNRAGLFAMCAQRICIIGNNLSESYSILNVFKETSKSELAFYESRLAVSFIMTNVPI